jgi:hypothetical protein
VSKKSQGSCIRVVGLEVENGCKDSLRKLENGGEERIDGNDAARSRDVAWSISIDHDNSRFRRYGAAHVDGNDGGQYCLDEKRWQRKM